MIWEAHGLVQNRDGTDRIMVRDSPPKVVVAISGFEIRLTPEEARYMAAQITASADRVEKAGE